MSEFRKNPVSGSWVIMASERALRPNAFAHVQKRKRESKKDCPFEDLMKSGNEAVILKSPETGKWKMVIVPNKYPVLAHLGTKKLLGHHGIYLEFQGIGHHELLVTRDHDHSFAHLASREAADVFMFLAKRYHMLAADPPVRYVSTFLNYGRATGGTLYHPHYQILALPIIPPEIMRSLEGSEAYFKRHKRCAHCAEIAEEKKEKKRIIAENDRAIAFVPYSSRTPFIIKIFPKRHLPAFEEADPLGFRALSALVQVALRRLETYAGDPDLNFFIHSAPVKDRSRYRHYHSHVEIVPRITTLGGFELATGLYINVVDPDDAARILRGEK